MRVKSTTAVFAFVLALCVIAGATTIGDLEGQIEAAKIAYAAEPSAANLALVEDLVTKLEAVLPEAGSSVRAQAMESEPNNDAGTANALTTGLMGDFGTGDISPAGDIDWWSAPGALRDLIFVRVHTNTSTGTDSQLNVYENDGTTLIEFDDDDGPGLSSCVGGAVIGQGGNVYFRVNEYGDNGEISPYDVFQAILEPGDFGAEVEPNNDFTTATPFTGQGIAGDFPAGTNDLHDWFSVALSAGDILVAILDADPDDAGWAGTRYLEIVDIDGSSVLADDEEFTARAAISAGPITAAVDGTYYVHASSDTEAQDYRLVVIVNGTTIPVELMSLSIE